MGIHDRDYAAAPPPRGRFSITFWLIVINAVIFIGTGTPILNGLGWPTFIRYEAPPGSTLIEDTSAYYTTTGAVATAKQRGTYGTTLVRPLRDTTGKAVGTAYYEVTPALYAFGHFSTMMAFQRLEVWRLITFQFLHAGVMHIFFNMLGLWMMGRLVEDNLGGKKYLAFYLMCGICGGLMYLILNSLGIMAGPSTHFLGLLKNDTQTPLVGASAGVFGVIMACAYLAPNEIVQLLIPPIPLKMRTFAYSYVGIAAASLILGSKNAGGEAAHIGGAIAGYFFVRNSHLLRDFFDVFSDSRRATRAKTARKAILRTSDAEKGFEADREVDRILAKVNAEGLQSLTEKEKRVLADATARERDR